ncbi:ABC transporter related protein [Xylanimonas cellulosilytica DSM 15894]|uniref:ABC transporter related protein n=1 Tax=Xylanimonas cellulosilytica (strain DSM 15894 / JCM 12276 / CECT 5975 / KCTC 9989 / LMG 20990 / NBRC 107835 / XIL07) TaxID=446471 RepID=D1BYE5_XYLCX|nr:ABC transporter ATP-binding protein [Xylanimonas cellulosilytica]ACZ31817.1 ABC transporter related protein [Xylanimonas cellulosilytica DSM 15894]
MTTTQARADGAVGALRGGIRARGLTKTYGAGPTAVHALRGVDLDVAAGSLVVLSGRSGAGKTTLLNCLTGLDRPDAGTAFLGDGEVTAMSADQLLTLRRDSIGFVFQTFGLMPLLTAAENVGVPLRLRRTPVAEREERVRLLLDLVDLRRHADQRPGELSGGEQQRVAIARALVTDPAVLVADEPTGQLDSRTGHQIMDLIEAVTRERGTTTLVASHDPGLIARADQHLELLDGRLER